jgi:DNA helicase HerA-like ATPase
MTEPLIVARSGASDLGLPPSVANRHGCITGATGTGKTVTLQVMAENFSRIGVPVFMADVKGDLTGIAMPGKLTDRMKARLAQLGLAEPAWQGCPVTLWDVWGEQGHPIRATVSDMGPLLMARLLNLNETQQGVLALTFKVADENGLLLLDLKDLRALLQFVGENAARFRAQYGNVSPASIGAIQRGLLQIDTQGGELFFGEPMLDIHDLIQTVDGRGVVNILAADRLMNSPRVYGSFLLWTSRSCGWCAPRASASISSRRIRSTSPTRSSPSLAIACSMPCARSRPATRRRCARRRKRCAPIPG